ncbi:MAG: phospholipid scramblase family protein [Actinomycetota bacterium]|nr:phospholipid scramblase family protein [Actinomycetota bacterium]
MKAASMLERDALILQRPAIEGTFRNEYAVLDERGKRIGTLTETRPAALGSRLGLAVAGLPLLPITLELQDEFGAPVVEMAKPWGRMVTHVTRGDGSPLGCVRRRWRLGKSRFELVSDDTTVGQVRAQNWRATEFTVVDAKGSALARAEKQRRVVDDRDPAEVNAERYLIRIDEHAAEPLRSLAVGAALALEAVVPHGDS